MDKRYFSVKIVKWYQDNKRNLPWRHTKDPYKIWLSEIILQQTRVSQGLPYYYRFIEKYPTVDALAAATEQEVLRLWQGLGYYSRARNLHKCAKVIATDLNSRFPPSYASLRRLPGIGEYTAAAIASIAFQQPVAVVDGNVFRVLSRLFGIEKPINSGDGRKAFTLLANDLVSVEQPDLHNQAVMEFGALFCTPVNPLCEKCIFQKNCFAYQHDLQSHLPVKLKLQASRKRYFYYVVFECGKKLLMKKREQKDIWTGLFDFHLIEKKQPVKAEKILDDETVRKIARNAGHITISKNYRHVLTHQTIFSRFIVVKSSRKFKPPQKGHYFYSFREIEKLPKPVLVTRFLSEHYLL